MHLSGVIIDSQLSLSSHVAALCRSGFYHLRQLRQLCLSLPAEATKPLVQAFISCRLDYCNSLLYGVTDSHAASTVGAECCGKADHRTKRCEHITPILCLLHWLPVRQELNSRLPASYTKCCQAKYLAIWPTIFISPQKVLLAPSGPLR